MISGQSFLVLAPGPWDDLWRSRHQIMSRLARRNTVLWVEPRLSLRRTRRVLAAGRRLRWLPRVEHVADGLHVLHNPHLLPASGPAPLLWLSNTFYDANMRRTMRRLGMSQLILWLYLPEMAAIIGKYGERLVVYHVIDEYTTYGGMNPAYVPTMQAKEAELLGKADVVITTAPALLESKSCLSRNVHLVPNAVDYEGFQRILANTEPPPTMSALPQPVIGYVGAINDKLDYDLLREIAVRRPDWSLAMVGPVLAENADGPARCAELGRLPNVHFLGKVGVPDVARYMAACQVCLLPYKINERTRNISSLKMYEYLACGKPVVSTDVPAAHEVGTDVVRIAGADTFVSAIEHALHDDAQHAARRRQVAAANTWDQRVEAISAILEKTL